MKSKEFYKKATKYASENKYDLAVEYYIKTLDIDSNHLKSLKELGELYEKNNNYDKAIKCYEKILKITPKNDIPTNAIYLNQIGVCYSKIEDYKQSITYFKKIFDYKRDIYEVYDNLSLCYFKLREYKLSEINSLISIKLKPGLKAYKDLGLLYFCTKEYDKSIINYNEIFKIGGPKPLIDGIKYISSFPYLAKKKFIKGFELYEYRLINNDINIQTGLKERAEIPLLSDWDGYKPCNELLIVYEQGIGDNILYYRFIIELSKKYPNMKITYFCKNVISHILKEYENITVVKDITNLLKFNFKLYIMSLPFILKTNEISPNVENYIKIDQCKTSYWKNVVGTKRFNVGFFYKGLLNSYIEKFIPLEEFKILSDLDVNLICLHKLDEIKNDLDLCDFRDKIKTYDIDNDEPFTDTISILNCVDLLITVDTSVAHLAGVMGVKTILMLGYVTDWRWFDNNDKIWFNNVDIVRMRENKPLKFILPEVKSEIVELMKIKDSHNS